MFCEQCGHELKDDAACIDFFKKIQTVYMRNLCTLLPESGNIAK